MSSTSESEQLSRDSVISRIIDSQLSESGHTQIFPMIIHLGDRAKFHVMRLNFEQILDPGFASLAVSVCSLVKNELSAHSAALLLPCIREGSDSISIVSSIDLASDPEVLPFMVAFIDDGETIEPSIFRISGIPGQALMAIPEVVKPSSEAFGEVLEVWERPGQLNPGFLVSNDIDGMGAEPGAFVWLSESTDLAPLH